MKLHVIILAAGQGTRMKSKIPKVLHTLAGKPLLAHVLDMAEQLNPDTFHVVYGHGGQDVIDALNRPSINWVHQDRQLGTGHAVQQAMKHVEDGAFVCILYGDVPLLSFETVQNLLSATENIGVLTACLDEPYGYGRIVRNSNGNIVKIVEDKDATDEESLISEINTGVLCSKSEILRGLLGNLEENNSQGEMYLTDVVSGAVEKGIVVDSSTAIDKHEIAGVNNKLQLAELERYYQQQKANQLMLDGIILNDPARIDIRGELHCGQDTRIDVNCVFEGTVKLGSDVKIGPNVLLKNCEISDGCEIRANSVIEDSIIGDNCIIGPFARIRPGTVLQSDVHVGNFVEIKNSDVSTSSKINHLTYIGDATIGKDVNIGAGTITCNYDGASKHRTIIGDRVFVGSGCELVAPITLSEGVTTGAGSTLTKDVNADTLVVERSKAREIPGWKRPEKK